MSKIIDLHAHVVLEAGFGQAGKFGPELAKDHDRPHIAFTLRAIVKSEATVAVELLRLPVKLLYIKTTRESLCKK